MSKRVLASLLCSVLVPLALGGTLACPGDRTDADPGRVRPGDGLGAKGATLPKAEREQPTADVVDVADDAGSDVADEDDTGTSAGHGAGAAAVQQATVTLPALGLQAIAPSGSKVGDALVGEGMLVQGPDLVVSVEVAPPSRPKTKAAAEKVADRYRPTKVESQRLDDGWAVTYDNEGRMGESYFVKVRRKIGEQEYWCEATAAKPEQRANALEFCRSLDRIEPEAADGMAPGEAEARDEPTGVPRDSDPGPPALR